MTLELMLSIIGFLAIYGAVVSICHLRRVMLFNSIRCRIQDMAFNLARDSSVMSEESRGIVAGTLLNEMEFLAALVRRGNVPRSLVMSHYGRCLVMWYDNVMPQIPSSWKEPPSYHEIRALVEDIRKSSDRRIRSSTR